MLTDTSKWSHARGNDVVPSRWQATLQSRTESLRLFRNRIAHHEPIFGRHLAADHASILLVAGWLEPDVRRWIADHSRVPGTLARRDRCVDVGDVCAF